MTDRPIKPAASIDRLLVVGDEDINRRFVRSILHEQGLPIFECEFASCVGVITRTTPRAVILDLGVATVSGLEALRRIRRMVDMPDLPIIVLIEARNRALIKHAFVAGASGFLIRSAPIAAFAPELEAVAQLRSITM